MFFKFVLRMILKNIVLFEFSVSYIFWYLKEKIGIQSYIIFISYYHFFVNSISEYFGESQAKLMMYMNLEIPLLYYFYNLFKLNKN